MTRADALTALQVLYARIPTIACQRLCGDACGPIGMNFLEWTNLRNHARLPLVGKSHSCPLLRHGACTAYQWRPLICRLWGTTEPLRCHHGCEPERWLTPEETNAILREGEALSQALFPGQPPRHTHTIEQVRVVAEQAAEDLVMRRMIWHSTKEQFNQLAQLAERAFDAND